jgi:hypothetical protein
MYGDVTPAEREWRRLDQRNHNWATVAGGVLLVVFALFLWVVVVAPSAEGQEMTEMSPESGRAAHTGPCYMRVNAPIVVYMAPGHKFRFSGSGDCYAKPGFRLTRFRAIIRVEARAPWESTWHTYGSVHGWEGSCYGASDCSTYSSGYRYNNCTMGRQGHYYRTKLRINFYGYRTSNGETFRDVWYGFKPYPQQWACGAHA